MGQITGEGPGVNGGDTGGGGTADLPALFSADFSALALGAMTAAAFLTATGVTLTRFGPTCVMTSASTIASDVLEDEATIGCTDGANKGLVIQPIRFNSILNTRNFDPFTSYWINGQPQPVGAAGAPLVWGITVNAATGPDGQMLADSISVPANGYSSYAQLVSALPGPGQVGSVISFFYRGSVNARMGCSIGVPNAYPAMAKSIPSSGSWARHSLAPDSVVYFAPLDARDTLAVGGGTPVDMSAEVDFATLEYGPIPGEPFVDDANPINYPATVDLPSAATYVDDGTLTLRLKFYPRTASTQPITWQSAGGTLGVHTKWFLVSADASNYVRIDATTKYLEVAANGTTATSGNALSYAAEDLVEVWVQFAGNRPSAAWYKAGAGAWTNLSLSGTIAADFDIPSALALFRNAAATLVSVGGHLVPVDGGQLFAHVKSIDIYPNTATR